MRTPRLAVLLTLATTTAALTTRADDKPAAAPVPVHWKVAKGDRFTATWKFTSTSRMDAGDHYDDKREVDMEWVASADAAGEVELTVEVKKATWSWTAIDFRVDVSSKGDAAPTATWGPTGTKVPELAGKTEERAQKRLAELKGRFGGPYMFRAKTGEPGRILVGGPSSQMGGASVDYLFNHFIAHPAFPAAVAAKQRWNAGFSEVPDEISGLGREPALQVEVSQVTDAAVTFVAKWSKDPADKRGRETIDQKYVFSREGYLASASQSYSGSRNDIMGRGTRKVTGRLDVKRVAAK